ncbi:MAG: hypothetical protein M1812_007731 [Candelaria pacifica]|nr:MAG: hypothetical protein M1812_007731 [Candelaria pacifica]
MANPRARVPLAIGVVVAGAGGYYLYAAGGDSKVAQKKAEGEHNLPHVHDQAYPFAPQADAARIGGSRQKSAQKQGEEIAQELGSKLDHTVDEARSKLSDADQKVEKYTKDLSKQVSSELGRVESETAKELKDTVNTFDKTVERKTVEAKKGISSWLGFGGK